MARTFAVAGLTFGLLAAASAELFACGDKSLSAGGIRMQRALAARYPATVLIYAPTASRLPSAMRELHFQEVLQTVGHQFREVSSAPDLTAALSQGQFNVVIADVADLSLVQQQVVTSAPHATVVAMAYKLTKAETAAAAGICRFVIAAPSHAARYLTTIADAVRARGKLPQKA